MGGVEFEANSTCRRKYVNASDYGVATLTHVCIVLVLSRFKAFSRSFMGRFRGASLSAWYQVGM